MTGNATLWLFTTTSNNRYTISAFPPAGSPFATFNISSVSATSDKSINIILQFVHAPPVTIATVDPPPDVDSIYPDPVTISLSATAAAGYVISATHYSLDGGPVLTYTTPFTISGNGTHAVQYWSGDDLGVFELPKTLSLQIGANDPPSVDAGGPYSLPEGSSIPVMAIATDPDNDPLTYAWDFNADDVPDAIGAVAFFSAAALDGPLTRTITVQVSDTGALTDTDTALVRVTNAPPTAQFVVSGTQIYEGESTDLIFRNAADPSPADTTAGFRYSFDCTNDGSFDVVDSATDWTTCSYATVGMHTARGRIADKDGGYNDYIAQVSVIPFIPPLVITTGSPLPNGQVAVPYSVVLAATGGTPPYTWSVASGALPPGLSLDAVTGEISGNPTTAGTFGFTIQVMDSSAVIVTKQFALAPPPSSGTAGSGYSVPVSVIDTPSGGSPPRSAPITN